MKLLFIVAILIVVAVIAVLGIALKGKKSPPKLPYRLADNLLSKAERSFYGVLVQAVGETAIIFSKVRVADVLTVKQGLDRSEWQRAFNAISAKHFDFLLCDPQDCSVRMAIELDDASHGTDKSRKRDALLNGACEAAGLPLLRMPAAKSYVVADLRAGIAALLSPADAALPAPAVDSEPDDAAARLSTDGQNTVADASPMPPSDAQPACPKCGETMVLRTAKSGDRAGKDFWGCSLFPKCRGIVQLEA